MSLLFCLLLVSNLIRQARAAYSLVQDYSGESFFDGWDFFTAADPTNGHVLYQSQADAQAKGLIGTQNGGQMFIGVDSTNEAPGGRPAVRITTRQTYQHGLIVADIAHQPGSICGVWPAFWMVGSNWPENGEVDIVEGVSTQATNQMTLHTDAGPILSQTSGFTGRMVTQNCDVNAADQPKNAGCSIMDDSALTFGSNFNTAGGGVYATEWTSDFIKIWFFPRGQIPADVQSGTPVPGDSWGMPNSLFQGSFSMDQHFNNLQIVLNTAFCGDWAGATWSSTPECAALAPTCDEYVSNNPQAFTDAYWLVNSVKVFSDDGTPGAAPTATIPTPITTSWAPWGQTTPAIPTNTPVSTPAFSWGATTPAASFPTSASSAGWPWGWGWSTASTPYFTSTSSEILTYMPVPPVAPTATTVAPWGGHHSHSHGPPALAAVTDIPASSDNDASEGTKRKRHGGAVLPLWAALGFE